MKLEQQVVSLELAQKMKELGFKQESLYYYSELSLKPNGATHWQLGDFKFYTSNNHASAYTVAELGEMLPDNIKVDGNSYWYEERKTHISDGEIYYIVYYKFEHPTKGDVIAFNGNTEADARAKMLIYLVENNLMTI